MSAGPCLPRFWSIVFDKDLFWRKRDDEIKNGFVICGMQSSYILHSTGVESLARCVTSAGTLGAIPATLMRLLESCSIVVRHV